MRDRVYDRVATNRYRLFGKSEQCALLSADQRALLVDDDAACRAAGSGVAAA